MRKFMRKLLEINYEKIIRKLSENDRKFMRKFLENYERIYIKNHLNSSSKNIIWLLNSLFSLEISL